MADRIRTVIVGAGRGRSHLRSLLALTEQYELAGVVDLDAARLSKLCAEEALAEDLAYRSLDEALAATACDAVVVATWARTHEALVEQALQAGAHVLVEKPFTFTVASAHRLLELAAARDRKIAVVQQWRYLPGQRTMRRLLREQRWGQPQVGHLLSYKARGGEYPDSPHSQLWQMTVHEVDSLLAMMGQPVAAGKRALLLPAGHHLAAGVHGHRRADAAQRLPPSAGVHLRCPDQQFRAAGGVRARRGALPQFPILQRRGVDRGGDPEGQGVAVGGHRSRTGSDSGPAGGRRFRRLDQRWPGAGDQRAAQPAGAGRLDALLEAGRTGRQVRVG